MTLSLKSWAFAALAGFALAGGTTGVIAKQAGGCPALKSVDPDNDGTMDLNEAKTAASKLFDRLEKDKDSTLTTKELQGRLSRKDFAAADPDKDKTLSKDEYLAAVESRFKAADPDNDSTIDCKEAKSASGRALLRLLK